MQRGIWHGRPAFLSWLERSARMVLELKGMVLLLKNDKGACLGADAFTYSSPELWGYAWAWGLGFFKFGAVNTPSSLRGGSQNHHLLVR